MTSNDLFHCGSNYMNIHCHRTKGRHELMSLPNTFVMASGRWPTREPKGVLSL